MNFKYQIIFLGYYEALIDEIKKSFEKNLNNLNIQIDSFKYITEKNFSEYEGNQPAFCIYVGEKDRKDINCNELNLLEKNAIPILPVYYDNLDYSIPLSIKHINALEYCDLVEDKISNLILESFKLLRSTRKVFISYKRDDSRAIALQLYERLESHNFTVFLDTHSIDKGVPFQDELWHQMTDCETVLLLNSPNFLESKWCKEEFVEANTKQIGILCLNFPDSKKLEGSEFCNKINLENTDFESSNKTLREDVMRNIIASLESTRARNFSARKTNLLSEFLKKAKKSNCSILFSNHQFLLDKKNKILFFPVVGIPTSFDYHNSAEFAQDIKETNIEKIYIIYDDLRIRDKWIKHLDWLDLSLNVKTLKKKDFEGWLQNH